LEDCSCTEGAIVYLGRADEWGGGFHNKLKKLKTYNEVLLYVITMGFPIELLSGRSNLACRSLTLPYLTKF
jgi:hypothetical protein